MNVNRWYFKSTTVHDNLYAGALHDKYLPYKAVCVNINQRLKSKYRNTAHADGGIVEWRIGGLGEWKLKGKGLEETVGGRLEEGVVALEGGNWRKANMGEWRTGGLEI